MNRETQWSCHAHTGRNVLNDIQIAFLPSRHLPMMPTYTEYRELFGKMPMPFAFVNLDLFQQNVEEVAARAADKQIRVATKSVRSVAMLRHLKASSLPLSGWMCFTAQEALYLAEQGFDELLLGYPIWHPDAIQSVARAIGDGRRITLMLDSVDHVRHIANIAEQVGVRIPVCIDIDMSTEHVGFHFGVRRSPVRAPESALTVAKEILASPWLILDAIMGYEAQIAGVIDNFPGQAPKNAIIRALKRQSIPRIAERRAKVVAEIEALGVNLRVVNGGGTGSMVSTCSESCVTEVTVGSGFYSPGLFDHYRQFRFQPAAGFAVEIVRRPGPNLYTCAGGGYIASGAVGVEKLPLPFLPEGLQLLPLEGAGEVQTPLRYAGSELNLGYPVFFRHSKAGELCERFTHLYLVSGGQVVDKVTTYRGDGQCFL